MTIQVLGSGCAKCHQLEDNARAAVAALGIEAGVEHITDPDTIVDMGVMITPALTVDGEVLSAGKVLSTEQIVKLLK